MTVITDKHGNMMNAELIIKVENDPGELKMLASALLEENKRALAALSEISQACVGEIAMGYRLDAQSIGQSIYEATGKTSQQLSEGVNA